VTAVNPPAPSTTAAQLAEAMRQHKAGAFAEAERLYRRVLDEEPANERVVLMVADLQSQRGHHDAALRTVSALIARNPAHAQAYNARARIYGAVNRRTRCLADLDRALVLQPDYAEALHNRGNVLTALARFAEAEASFRAAITASPAFADAYAGLGILLLREGRTVEAVAALETALRLEPGLIVAQIGLCDAAVRLKDDALTARALAGAQALAQAAFSRDPVDAETIEGCASALTRAGHAEQAIALLQQAIAREGGNARLHNALGWNWLQSGAPAAAIPHFRRALLLDPAMLKAGMNLAIALLITGDWRRGWDWYETRLRLPRAQRLPGYALQQRWQGENLAGRSILLYNNEQGLGDVIQFVRFVPDVAARAATVVLTVPPELLPVLCTSMPENVTVIGPAGRLPQCDFFAALGSLPLLLDVGAEELARGAPYLRVDPGKQREWNDYFAADARGLPRVGFVWAGAAQNSGDARRSCSVRALAPLFALGGIRGYSLQTGPRAREVARAKVAGLVPLDDRILDFSDTLAILANLDLLVSVDTAAAHAAGAIGAPVINMLPFMYDWRWGFAGETTIWYSSMRLFRQDRDRRWEPVMARVATELKALAARGALSSGQS
jgi:tetratricopeptide (TPR) repeat protein